MRLTKQFRMCVPDSRSLLQGSEVARRFLPVLQQFIAMPMVKRWLTISPVRDPAQLMVFRFAFAMV
ncbi:hypothetical protein CBP34_16170 [Acidovorax carolinensis]|uniref:Uncharacterized protein n=1 Tax=Acidovorax carolinensis TaxID=553814 RepID=A0A240U4X0_9BURK|nr:hypothetical protein CBP34_16170 [Acidovorax carolinensis]